jgi:hypothetical protein
MSSRKGRSLVPWAWAIVLFAACGGSVVESIDDDDGGAGGQPGGASGSSAATGPGGRGGAVGASGRGGRGGGGASGASGAGTVGGRAGSAGFGGGAGYGGSGPICVDQGCGPPGYRCCQNRSGCSVSGPGGGYSCDCIGGIWSCTDPSAGDGTCPFGACSGTGLVCCRGRCANLQNDPYNCGFCGNICPGRYCDYGSCGPVPCYVAPPIDASGLCCGDQICGSAAQLCCNTRTGPQSIPFCHTPSPAEPTCPIGCPNCF